VIRMESQNEYGHSITSQTKATNPEYARRSSLLIGNRRIEMVMIRDDVALVTCDEIPVDRLRGRIPSFCELIFKEGDPLMVIRIDYWPAKLDDYLLGDDCLPGDERVDYEFGDTLGREAVWFIRNRYGATLLALILNSMGKRLHEERRSPHPLEVGFLDRLKSDVPDVIDAVAMDYVRQNPRALN
jgi:hypothetical protein